MFCKDCGSKLINNDCSVCFYNSTALRQFEEEDD